jgi:phosphohistidine phosphatase
MPRLLLLRHAKAERAHAGEKDHSRVLSKRGRSDAEEMGRRIAENGERPDLVLCSTSQRTRQTWELVGAALADAIEMRFMRALYEAADYLDILKAEGGHARSVLLIGHNPAIQGTAVRLCAPEISEGVELSSTFPTAALAIFESDAGWAELEPATMHLVAFIRPREQDGD